MCSRGPCFLMSDSEGRNARQSRAHASVLRPGQCLPQHPGQQMICPEWRSQQAFEGAQAILHTC